MKPSNEFKPGKPGIYQNIRDVVYHQSPGISKSGLDKIRQSPAHYIANVVEDSPALLFGRALHCLVLEYDRFKDDYAVSVYKDLRTKAAREWKAEQKDKTILSQEDYTLLMHMTDSIYNHPKASALIDSLHGKAEQSIYWIDQRTGCLCRCRPDFFNDQYRIAIDLKSTTCAGYSAFARDIAKYNYHMQAAFYMEGLRAAGITCDDFILIAVEKKPPFAVACYSLDYDALQAGRVLFENALDTYRHASTTNRWPAYSEDIRVISLPPYAYKKDEY